MLLTITTTHNPAGDLGYLLHKHPDRVQQVELSFGQAHILYPEISDERCTCALVMDLDPVLLTRGKDRERQAMSLQPYVNDRPYVASSHLAVAIGRAFRTAMTGVCKGHEELAATAIPLEATIAVVRTRGGLGVIDELFAPLGYTIEATHHPLDEQHPEWGESQYFTLRLKQTIRLSELLKHLVVLLPALDERKHYFIGSDEVDKLLVRGEGWLDAHPSRELITARYLGGRRSLSRQALEQLIGEEEPDADEKAAEAEAEEEAVERDLSLNEQRLGAVVSALKGTGASRVLDLGCGEGKLLRLLLADRNFREIVGMDVSIAALEKAARRLRLDSMPRLQRERIDLMHGSLMYRDRRLDGFDAAAVVEVIEHLDPPRLAAFERVLFEHAKPANVVLTTPNQEYNSMWETLPAGDMRHRDHRFEWTRAEFQAWAGGIADRYGYEVRFQPIGPEDDKVGAPTQMGVFSRAS